MISIDEIIGKSKEYGIAKTNVFRITIENIDRFADTRFKYVGDNDSANVPRRIQFMADECEFPVRTIDTHTNDARWSHDMARTSKYDNIDITFKLGQNFLERRIFDLWMAKIVDVNTQDVEYYDNYTTNILIEVFSGKIEGALFANRVPVYAVKLIGAFPSSVATVKLGSGEQTEFPTVAATFQYRRWEIVKTDGQSIPSLDTQATFDVFNPDKRDKINDLLPKAKEAAKVGFDLKSVTAKITKTLDTTKGLLSLNQGETVNLYNKVNDFFTKNTGLSVNEAKRWTEQTKRDVEAITDEDVLSNANKVVLVGGLANILGLLPKP